MEGARLGVPIFNRRSDTVRMGENGVKLRVACEDVVARDISLEVKFREVVHANMYACRVIRYYI